MEDKANDYSTYGGEIEPHHISKTKVTAREYTAYNLMTRKVQDNGVCYLHRLGRLKDEYIVDSWVAIEDSRLKFYKKHQHKFRRERQQGIGDAIRDGETNPEKIGQQ